MLNPNFIEDINTVNTKEEGKIKDGGSVCKAEFVVDICMISISLSPSSLYPVQHIHVCLCSRHCPNTKDTCFAWICAGYSCTLEATVKLPITLSVHCVSR